MGILDVVIPVQEHVLNSKEADLFFLVRNTKSGKLGQGLKTLEKNLLGRARKFLLRGEGGDFVGRGWKIA